VTDPITVTAPADQTNNEGDSASLTISASDSTSGATLDYAAFGLPPGLAINASSGAISGTISGGASAGGPYSVTVVAEDGTSSASASFNWNINDPVSFTASGSGGSVTTTVPGTQTNTEGDSVSLTLSASNSGSGTLIYSTLDLPPGLSINPTSGAITGTVAIGDAPLSAYEPTITASNGASSDSADFEWDINGSVSITDPGNQSNTVGDSVSLQILTTYDGSGTLSYAASGLPAGLSISTSSGLISGTVGSGATAIGTYTTTVTAGDGNSTASDTFTWTITAAGTVTLTTPSDQSNSEGDSVSLSLSASGGGTLKYFAEGLPPGLKLSPSSGAITGTVALGDTATGPYNVTVSATDGTHSAGEAFNWTVTDPVTITSVPGQTGTEGGSVSVSVSASDTSGGTLAYGAIGLPPGLVINPSTGAITGTMALGAAAAGTYTVTVIAGDSTYSASQTFDWGPGSPVTITSPGDQTNTEGDTVSLSISASDSGGTVKYSAYGLPAGLHINTSSGAITGTVAPGASAQGPYTVVVTASDGTYGASVTFNWTINDPITITNPGVQDVSEGESVSLAIHASDSHGGTLSYNAVNLPLGLVINSATGVISGTISNTLAAAGAFVGRITATDGTYSNTMLVYFEEEEPKGTGKGPGKANGVPQGSINGWSIIVTVGDAEVKLGSMDIDFMVSVDSLYPLKDYEITQFVTNNTKLWDKDGKKLSTKDLYKAYRDSNISFSAGSDPLCTNSKDAGWGDGNDWLAFAGKTDQTIKDTHISNVPVYTEKGKDMYYAFEKSSTMVIKIRDKSSKKVVATYQWSYTFRNYKGNSPKAPIVDIDPVGLYDYEGIFGVPKDIDFKGK